MKNKFKPILELRKQEVKIHEKKVALIIKKIREIKEEISNLTNTIHNVQIPNNGKIAQVTQSRATITILRREVDTLRHNEMQQNNTLEQAKDILKTTNIECEKATYLFQEEEKKRKEYIKKQEQKELDDISQRSYSVNKKKSFTNLISLISIIIPIMIFTPIEIRGEEADISFKCNRIFEGRKNELVELLDSISDERQVMDSINAASKAVLDRKSESLDKRKKSLDKKEKNLTIKLARLNKNIKRNEDILKEIQNKLLSKLSTAFTKMSPAKAGGILEAMEDGEASSILFLLKPKVMSNIMSKMTPDKSASITLLIKQGPPFKKDIKTYAIKKPKLIEKAIEEDFK